MRFFTTLVALAALAAGAAAPAARAQDAGPGAPGPRKAAPRVLVLTFGRGDQRRDDQASKIQGIAEETLLDFKFPLVDESQLMASYQLDDLEKFLILTPERARMAELKARFGCELICVVQFTRSFQYEKEIMGTQQRFYKTDVRVKAIVPDTAEVVFSSGGETTIEARTAGMEQLARDNMKKLAEKVLERWSHEAFGTIQIQIAAKGFDHSGYQRLEQAVRGFPNVVELVDRSFSGKAEGPGNGLFEVKYNGAQEELRAALVACPDPPLDVLSATPARIEVVMASKLALAFVSPPEGAVVAGADVEAAVQVSGGRAVEVVIGEQPAQPDQAGNYRARVALPKGGAVTIVARAKGESGKTAEAQRRLVVDAGPPTVSIVSPKGGLSNQKVQDVVVSAADDSGSVSVQVNGQPAQPRGDGTFGARVQLPEGASEIVAVATDPAGQSAQARVTVTVDSVPPRLDGKVIAIIEGRVDKPGTVVTCEGKPVEHKEDGSFRITVEALAGSSVTVVAVDPAGNRTEKVYRIGDGAPQRQQ